MTHAYASAPAILALVGADGAGKSTLLADVGQAIASDPRAVQVSGRNAAVLDVWTPSRVVQLVDFANLDTQAALLGASRFAGAVLVVSAADGALPPHRASLQHARELHIPLAAIAMTKCDLVADEELIDLVEMELRELLNAERFPGDATPVVRVRAPRAPQRDGREPEPTGRARLTGPQALLAVLGR